MEKEVKEAVTVLRKGGIVIFPTDTAFGIGCRIDDEKAIKRLFEIRKRPKTQATPVLVDTVSMAQKYLLPIPREVINKLIEPYWPGALTIVLSCIAEKVPLLVRGGGNTIGVRIPNHHIPRLLIREVGVPILGPSANFHGEKTPFYFADLDKELVKRVDFVVAGDCTICEVSTVIDCSHKPWKILRQGAIKINNENEKEKSDIILSIDTASNKKIVVGLTIDRKKDLIEQETGQMKSQVLLPLIDRILKKHHVVLHNLTGVSVNTGPGSFTGLRVGIAVANALGFSLNIPINGKKIGEFIDASYT